MPKTPEAGDERRDAERRQRSVWMAGERTAHESTSSASARPQRSDCSAASEPSSRRSRYSPKPTSAETAVKGTAASSASKREAVRSTGVGHCRNDREQSRKHSTSHELLASLSGRTVLLCSPSAPRRKGIGMATLTWLGHAAFRLDTDRRQADLRRPVPERQPEDAGRRDASPSAST